MIPHNPYIFLLLLILAAVGPVVSAGAPDVDVPPWVPYLFSIAGVAGGVVLKAMQPPKPEPQGTEVDQLIDRLEALPKEARDELSSRLEWRARLRGETD